MFLLFFMMFCLAKVYTFFCESNLSLDLQSFDHISWAGLVAFHPLSAHVTQMIIGREDKRSSK